MEIKCEKSAAFSCQYLHCDSFRSFRSLPARRKIFMMGNGAPERLRTDQILRTYELGRKNMQLELRSRMIVEMNSPAGCTRDIQC